MWAVPLTSESLICVVCAFDIGELDLGHIDNIKINGKNTSFALEEKSANTSSGWIPIATNA